MVYLILEIITFLEGFHQHVFPFQRKEAEKRDWNGSVFQNLLNLGLNVPTEKLYSAPFKGITFLTAYLAIPVMILFQSNKELQ